MKFTKTALAVAIVGIAAAPMAQADVTLSGYIGITLGSDDTDATDGEWALGTDDSSLNIAASHTLNSGLTGYGNYRLDGGLTDDAVISDAVRIGIKGGFGDFRLGDVVNPIEFGQTAGDILSDIGSDNVEEVGIGYTGDFGPVSIGLMWSPANNRDAVGAGIKFSVGGFAIGVGAGDIDEESRLSAGASFGIGGASVALAFKDFDNDRSTIGAKVGYGIGAVSLGLTFEAEAGDVNDGDSKLRLDAEYGLGGGMSVSTRINVFSSDNAASEKTDYRLMMTKGW